ncbi:MAG: phosphate signaling complex PhoU family protein [Acidimicrobiales bacterium]
MSEPGHELRRKFHQHLDEIDGKVIRLFALVSESVSAASDALLSGDTDAARELLTQTPMAGDMRYLVSVLRVVPELERSGDLAEHIAQRAVYGLALRLTPTVRGLLEQMGTVCVDLWRRAADAWAERDGNAAVSLDKADDQLDDLHDRLVAELEKADIALADALQTTLVARFYERLGDHAVHIAERVRYLADGT